jgi:hypothetical protein
MAGKHEAAAIDNFLQLVLRQEFFDQLLSKLSFCEGVGNNESEMAIGPKDLEGAFKERDQKVKTSDGCSPSLHVCPPRQFIFGAHEGGITKDKVEPREFPLRPGGAVKRPAEPVMPDLRKLELPMEKPIVRSFFLYTLKPVW